MCRLWQVISFYPIGLALGWYLGFERDMGVVGLWIGIDLGYVAMVLMLFVYMMRVDWDEQARLAKARSSAKVAGEGEEEGEERERLVGPRSDD